MVAIIILGFIILLIISTFLLNKKTITDKYNKAYKIKNILLLTTLVIFIVLIMNIFLFDGVKSFYCLSNDRCVTIWKRGNGEVLIIPGRYKSNNKPTVSYIRTSNKQFLTLYFSNEKELSYKIIVRDEGNLENNQKRYTIENDAKGEWQFLEYSNSFKPILFESNPIKFKDVKVSTDYLTIDIEENYAMDKRGKKIK